MRFKIPNGEHKYFYKRTKVLRKIGLWPKFDQNKSEILYIFFVGFILFSESISVSLVFTATLQFALEQREFNAEVCEQIILFVITFQMVLKMLVIVQKAKPLQKLIEDLSTTMRKKFVTDTKDFEIIKKCRKYDHKMSKFFCILFFIVLIVALIKPIGSIIKRKRRNHALNITEIDIIGELPSKYPFEVYEKSIWFFVIYIQQVSLSTLGAFTSWAVDSMLCSFLNYLCGHFDILANNIKNYEDKNYENEKVMARKLVKQHNFLINYAKELNSAFAPLIVMQLGLGALTIGLQMIQLILIKSASPFAYAKPISYLVVKLFQLYVFSWHGQLLWDRSLYIAEACWSSPWIAKSKSWNTCLRLMIMRSYRPIKVEVAIFQFSLERYRNTLNTSYSLFAMMNSVSPS